MFTGDSHGDSGMSVTARPNKDTRVLSAMVILECLSLGYKASRGTGIWSCNQTLTNRGLRIESSSSVHVRSGSETRDQPEQRFKTFL